MGKLHCYMLLFINAFIFQHAAAISCWVCENAYSEEECLENGYMKYCPTSETMCHIELRRGGWGEKPMIEKSCKTPVACGDNYVQNLRSAWAEGGGPQVQCNTKNPSSVCRCCCSTDQCNYKRLQCDMVGSCPAITGPGRGSWSCDRGSQPLSVCTFSCRRGLAVVGASSIICGRFGRWSDDPPKCYAIRCPLLQTPEFGTMTCTNGGRLRSSCRFSCLEGYRLEGAEQVKCIEDENGDIYGVWNRRQPKCIPLRCPEARIYHGQLSCTNKNLVGSVCTAECNAREGYTSYPSTFTSMTCQNDETWSSSVCCGLPCPPFAIMDFVLVLDSSSSVGASNWVKMKNFAMSFLEDFYVRKDSSRFGIVRYNREVDEDTRILLDDYTDNTQDVLDAFERVPYDGSGTHTGKALNYTADVMLKVGNRDIASDIVLVITDGKSQDDVAVAAKRVRDTGALLYVLPIQPSSGALDMEQIRSMVAHERFILRDALVRGFEALDEEFSAKITSILCLNPCQNPFHAHTQRDNALKDLLAERDHTIQSLSHGI